MKTNTVNYLDINIESGQQISIADIYEQYNDIGSICLLTFHCEEEVDAKNIFLDYSAGFEQLLQWLTPSHIERCDIEVDVRPFKTALRIYNESGVDIPISIAHII